MTAPILCLRHRVAQQFAERPTLRQVLGQGVLTILVKHYPLIAVGYPELDSAEPLSLMSPPDALGLVKVEPLCDVLLRAFLAGESMALGADHHLSLFAPTRFRAVPGAVPDVPVNQVNIDLGSVNDDLNALLRGLVQAFKQAQVGFWRGATAQGGQRDVWMRRILRLGLASRLSEQGLEQPAVDMLHGLLLGGELSPTVQAIEVELQQSGTTSHYLLADLLVSAELDERQLMLWCAPCGLVRTFGSQDEFIEALREVLAQRHAFEALHWSLHELEGDVVTQQVALMLDALLAEAGRIRPDRCVSVDALESAFAAASDPSGWFIDWEDQGLTRPALAEPDWLRSASDTQRMAYQDLLLDMSLGLSVARARSSQDDILDLQAYASEQLRQQMLADHPVDANYFSDDLILTLSVASGVPGAAGVGPGDGAVVQRTQSLTDFAIGNLSGLGGATISAIRHRDEQVIMAWMTPGYLRTLVEKVDIGGRYPRYVKQRLDDPLQRPGRVELHGREWRCRLLADALQAWVGGQISEQAWACVSAFCDSDNLYPPRTAGIAQLAFKRSAAAQVVDRVHGMYVIRPPSSSLPGVLYRPLYRQQPLIEIGSSKQLLGLIQQPGPLQDSVLDWLADDARRVYDHGGFLEPHLLEPISDTSILPSPAAAAEVSLARLTGNIDEQIYRINGELLVELASRQSTSTAHSRWALLTQGAWLLFNVIATVAVGPIALVAWLVQSLSALEGEVAALSRGSAWERGLAVMELLFDAGMLLLHARAPDLSTSAQVRPGLPRLLTAAEPRIEALAPTLAVALPGASQALPLWRLTTLQLDHGWSGAQGLNRLPPALRQRLRSLRQARVPAGAVIQTSGYVRGLLKAGDAYFVYLAQDAYQVVVSAETVRVVGPAGEVGPYLQHTEGQWRITVGGAGGAWDVSPASKARVLEVLEEVESRVQALGPLNASLLSQSRKADVLRDQLADLQALSAGLEGQRLQDHEALIRSLEAQRLSARLQAVKISEQLGELTRPLDDLLGALPQLRYSAEEAMQLEHAVNAKRSMVRHALLTGDEFIFDTLILLARDHDFEIDRFEGVAKERENPLLAYEAWHELLRTRGGLVEQLLATSDRLESLTARSLVDTSLEFKGKAALLTRLKLKRQLSKAVVRWGLAKGYAKLSIRGEHLLSNAQCSALFELLMGERFELAAFSHGDKDLELLSREDRMRVLNSVHETYSEAISNAELLLHTGGDVLDSEVLQRYKVQMELLRSEAARDLDDAIVAQAFDEPVVAQGAGQRPPSVAETISGQLVLGHERVVDGEPVIEQLGEAGQVRTSLRRTGGYWDVVSSQPPLALPQIVPAVPSQVARKAAELLGQEQWVLAEAGRKAAGFDAKGVAWLIDNHVGRLRGLGDALVQGNGAGDLHARIAGSVEALLAARDGLLVEAHSTTPYPTAGSLRFLHDKGLLRVNYDGPRRVLADGSALDRYPVQLLERPGQETGKPLWEVHLHYNGQADAPQAFAKGHLKTWAQRKFGYRDQLQAHGAGLKLKIYRGNLALRDVQGILPWA